jgi:hypothetical protein
MYPMIGAIGGLLGGAGQLAGGLYDWFGGGTDYRKARKYADKMAKDAMARLPQQMKLMYQGAQAAGYHPLAALGISPSAGPSVPVFDEKKGKAMANMGQGINRVLNAQAKYLESLADKEKKEVVQGQTDSIREFNLPSTEQPFGKLQAYERGGWFVMGPNRQVLKSAPDQEFQEWMTEGSRLEKGEYMFWRGKRAIDLTKGNVDPEIVRDYLDWFQSNYPPGKNWHYSLDRMGRINKIRTTGKKKLFTYKNISRHRKNKYGEDILFPQY